MNLSFLLDTLDLKEEERAGAEAIGVKNPETVAGHSWGVAFLVLIFSSSRDVDLEKSLKMALIHDLAECETGDIIDKSKYSGAEVSKSGKIKEEERAWDKISGIISEKHLNLWKEYESRESSEAKLVKDADMIEHTLQITRYVNDGRFSDEKVEEDLPEGFIKQMFENSKRDLETSEGEEIFLNLRSNTEGIDSRDDRISIAYEIQSLKDENRSGQQLYSIEDPNSIAAHSWGVAFLTVLFSEEDLDIEKAMKMALIHDIGEAEIGDFSRRADDANRDVTRQEKEEMERKAVGKFSNHLNFPLLELWEEYEGCETFEARFVRDMDRLDSCITALKNEKEGNYSREENTDLPYENLDEFFLSAEGDFRTEKGKSLFKKIREEYTKVKQYEI